MRLVGPNCLGVLNTDAGVHLNATFAPQRPPPGRIGFRLPERGASGIAAIEEAAGRGLGLSSFVSMGNKADLSGNDLLAYWEADPATDVVLLYLESFGNPRKFGRIARRLAAHKPVVAVKSGRIAGRSRGRRLAHRRAARRHRRDGGRAVPPRRRHPRRHAWASSSTWPGSWPTSRCPAVTASAS